VLSRDLMFSSQVAGAARAANVESQTVASAEAVVAAALDSPNTLAVLVDLAVAGLDQQALAGLITQLRERHATVRLIAVGAHVQTEKLAAAEQAGFEFVLTKGQARRELPELFAKLAAA
jgi:CheY-like chemotaxis protein